MKNPPDRTLDFGGTLARKANQLLSKPPPVRSATTNPPILVRSRLSSSARLSPRPTNFLPSFLLCINTGERKWKRRRTVPRKRRPSKVVASRLQVLQRRTKATLKSSPEMLISGGVPADGETFPSRVPFSSTRASTIFTWISLRTRASRTFPPPREIRLRKFHQTSRFLWFWVVTRAKKRKIERKREKCKTITKMEGGRAWTKANRVVVAMVG